MDMSPIMSSSAIHAVQSETIFDGTINQALDGAQEKKEQILKETQAVTALFNKLKDIKPDMFNYDARADYDLRRWQLVNATEALYDEIIKSLVIHPGQSELNDSRKLKKASGFAKNVVRTMEAQHTLANTEEDDAEPEDDP